MSHAVQYNMLCNMTCYEAFQQLLIEGGHGKEHTLDHMDSDNDDSTMEYSSGLPIQAGEVYSLSKWSPCLRMPKSTGRWVMRAEADRAHQGMM